MCRGHDEGPQDTEAEGALGVFGNLTTQRSQAADHRTARDGTLPLELLAHAHGGLLYFGELHLRHRECGVDCLLRRGLIRHLLPQLWAKEINVSYEKKTNRRKLEGTHP